MSNFNYEPKSKKIIYIKSYFFSKYIKNGFDHHTNKNQ